MTWQRAGRLGWLAPALAAALGAAFLPLTPAGDAEGVEALFVLTFVAYATVGALIVSRHPRNPIGWLFCAVGVLSAGAGAAVRLRVRAPSGRARRPRRGWARGPASPRTALIVLLLLLFPTGRFASPGWRRAGLAGVAATAVWALALALDPGTLRSSEEVVNPLGVEAAGPVLDVGGRLRHRRVPRLRRRRRGGRRRALPAPRAARSASSSSGSRWPPARWRRRCCSWSR